MAFQQSLDKWFVRKDAHGNPIEAPYKVFYLNWVTQKAQWLPTLPTDITFHTTIKWVDTIQLVGYFPNETQNFTVTETYYTNSAFLKSHLQKAIRRSQSHLALKTAYHLFGLDVTQLLRRLAIIMIEDVYLMESFSTLIWLTAAQSKGFHLRESQLHWILGLVWNLGEATYRDPVLEHKKFTSKYNHSVIYSLQFRKAFGGTADDKKLLDSVSQIWVERLQTNSKKLCDTPVYFISPPETPLELSEWILPAIDYHVAPNILSILIDKYEELEHDQLKEAIWIWSSSYNNKTAPAETTNAKETEAIWKMIRAQYYGIAEYFLTKMY